MRLGDLPLLVDHVRDPFRVFVFRGIGRAVRESDPPIGVAQQRERKVILFGELRVGSDIIEADAEDGGVLRFVVGDEVPEPGTLGRSTGCVGFRIKPKHDLAAAQIVKRNFAALMVAHLEVRSLIANVQHASSSERIQYKPQLACQRHAAIVVEVGKPAASTLLS
ncbi:MAG: hypothetical protein QOE68_3182 [Thermoanaerobaculia bacterium]|jgi:hypothetical protein|nr:hypothetical protein [Thermoanaerobaculia bacterium]